MVLAKQGQNSQNRLAKIIFRPCRLRSVYQLHQRPRLRHKRFSIAVYPRPTRLWSLEHMSEYEQNWRSFHHRELQERRQEFTTGPSWDCVLHPRSWRQLAAHNRKSVWLVRFRNTDSPHDEWIIRLPCICGYSKRIYRWVYFKASENW